MSGLQTIVDKCNGITVNRRKVAGVQITNNEIPRTVFTPTKQPWRFILEMPSSLRYNQARALLETLDTIDRITPQVITFGNNACTQWIFGYQGSFNTTQIGNLNVDSFIGNQLILSNLPAVAASRVIFEPGDLIQIGTSPHPFTSTTRILRSAGTTVTVTTNRPNILTSSVFGSSIIVGSQCEFKVFCPNMPVYKLTPGGFMRGQFGQTINNALIEFSDQFELYEWVGDA